MRCMTSRRKTAQERPDDDRSPAELTRYALTEQDEHAAWEPVRVLHFRGTAEVLAHAQTLCMSPRANERRLGANILGQLGVPDRTFPEECFLSLAAMLSNEGCPQVLEAIAVAYGHLHDPRAIKLLVPFVTHPDAGVRLGVVHGISRHNDDLAMKALIKLSKDQDHEVRNWATFGLGSMIDIDTAEIREALFARITDSNDDARGEALVGLSRRKDPRARCPYQGIDLGECRAPGFGSRRRPWRPSPETCSDDSERGMGQ
jgi:HEAT repeat protein